MTGKIDLKRDLWKHLSKSPFLMLGLTGPTNIANRSRPSSMTSRSTGSGSSSARIIASPKGARQWRSSPRKDMISSPVWPGRRR